VTERPCPACASTNLRDRGAAGEYRWRQCAECATASTDRLPTPGELAAFYADYYEDASEAPEHVQRRLDEVIDGWAPHRATGDVLDVGFGSGDLLRAAARHGWTCWGTELSEVAAEMGRGAGWTVITGDLLATDLPAGHFDVVAMVEVLEHLPDPAAYLVRAIGLLRPGGLLWGTTPNGGSLNHRLLGTRWPNVAPPEHLQLFSPRGLRELLRATGFTTERVVSRGLNPSMLLARRRPSAGAAAPPVRAPISSRELNAAVERGAVGRAAKRTLNRLLGITGVGDSLELRAVRPHEPSGRP